MTIWALWETLCIDSLRGMKNLFEAGRVLLLDLASTLLFLAIYLLTDNLFLAIGLGMVLGVVLASGTATFFTRDPHFVMVKPSVIYVIVGAVMLKRGWMNRYLPPRAEPVKDVATLFGYVWAGLMFFSALLNIALAFSLDTKSWAAAMSAWGIASKIGLFLIQYAAMNRVGKRRAKAAGATAPT
jgi:intracellular septation protein